MSNSYELPDAEEEDEKDEEEAAPVEPGFLELSKTRAIRDEEGDVFGLNDLLGLYYLDGAFMLKVLLLYCEHSGQELAELSHEDRERIYDSLLANQNIGEGGGYVVDMSIEDGDVDLVSFVVTDKDLENYRIH